MKIKKLGALLVSAALCAGMAAPAFAFEGRQRSRVRGGSCRLPQQGSKLFRRDLCSPHHLVDLGGILLLNAPFQNLDAVVQLDAAFLLFFQHCPQLIRFFAHSNSSNHFESRPNPARCFSQ